jgi:hypothetical protein
MMPSLSEKSAITFMEDTSMHPLQASAQFAAAVHFSRGKVNTPETREASRRFAKNNWVAFLPYAHEGWGRLLLRIAKWPELKTRPAARIARKSTNSKINSAWLA